MYLLSSSRLFEIFESPRCCVWSRQSRAAPSWQRLFMGLRYPKPVILRLKSRKALCCGRFRLLNIVSEESVASRMPRHSLQALPIQSESAGKLVSSGAPTSLAEIFVLQRSHNKSLTRHFCKGISVTMKFCRLCFVVAADPSAYHSVVFTRLSAPVTTHRSWAGARATGAAFPGRS
jgi:hypothetical protein